MVNLNKVYRFLRFQRGPTFSRGVQLFPGGSNCLFPIETHITCDFPGGVRTPCPPPLDPHLVLLNMLLFFVNQSWEFQVSNIQYFVLFDSIREEKRSQNAQGQLIGDDTFSKFITLLYTINSKDPTSVAIFKEIILDSPSLQRW